VLLSLRRDEPELRVIALLPGHYLPQLREGLELRLELTGYKYAYQEMHIDSVGQNVVGPSAAQRYLGREIADAVPVSGPVVLTYAKLSEPTFEADDQTYEYCHGMQGTAAVRVRTESILRTLLPWLKKLDDTDD
jgi:membrane fusion protein (multidrug efflux system)